MKKLLSLLFAVLIIVVCLISCDEGVEHLGHSYEYIPYETGHFKQYTCGCPSPDILEEHYDHDGDLFCDACGCVVSIPSYGDIKWQSSETHHWWVPKGEDVIGVVYGYGEHENFDADLHCDICGYLIVLPDPSEKILLSYQAGTEWMRDITSDDIAEINMIYDYGGVAPGTSRYVTSSSFEAPIRRIFNELLNMEVTPVPRDEAIVPGGSNLTVEILLKNGTKRELIFYDGCYYDAVNDSYYRLAYRPFFNDVPEYTSYYQYVTIGEWDKCEIWYDDPTEPSHFLCDIPLEELKYIIFNGNVGAGVSEYPYFIETDFGMLGFIDNDLFFVVGNGTYYQLVGKNLDELIAEYSITEE